MRLANTAMGMKQQSVYTFVYILLCMLLYISYDVYTTDACSCHNYRGDSDKQVNNCKSDKLRGGGSGVGGLIGQYPNSKLPWIRQLSYPAGCWLKGYHSRYLVRNL